MNHRRLSGAVALATVLAFSAGCASTQEIEELRALVEQNRSAAESAQSTADRAMTRAERAESTADEAERKADSALAAANEASNCCRENRERLDRMFEKAMQK